MEFVFGVKYDIEVLRPTSAGQEVGKFTGYELQQKTQDLHLFADPAQVDSLDDQEFDDFCADNPDSLVIIVPEDIENGDIIIQESKSV